ncbi:MAG TPA: FtsH protease activity modulator HflK, partial [Pseudoxanthomonas sp.]|nr:FtsH protease activity modulator HflK [Pseudoxanthomonas sp.]
APGVTRTRLWLETVQSVLAGNRKVVGGDGRQLVYVPMPNPDGTTQTQQAPALLPPDVVMPQVETNAPLRSNERSPRPTGREEATR